MSDLTPRMVEYLNVLAAGERSAYPGLSLGTLNALVDRGLVWPNFELGAAWQPRTHIKWRLSPKGHAALSASDKTGE